MTAPDDRNPLARALDEVGDGPEARAYSIPVEAVRAGARRRRARRTGLTSGLAVLAVAAVAGGAYAGLPGSSGLSTSELLRPGPQGTAGSSAAVDWPAQILRCGQAVGYSLPNVGEPMTLMLVDPSSSIAADGAWDASVIADVPTAPPGDVAVVWATDLSVVSNGVVVGVQEGPTAPDLSLSLNERLGDNALPTSSFPVTTKVTRALASCDQYPSGQGSPDLAPGTYTLVVTQTLSYAPAGAATTVTDVRSSATTTVTITPPVGPPAADPTGCGAAVDAIAALASPRTNPAPLTLSTGFHPTPSSYAYYPLTPTLTNEGTATLEGLTSEPIVVAVRDGVVVGRAQGSASRTDIRIAPGGSHVYPDPPLAERCPGTVEPAWGGTGLTAGDYELWVVVNVNAATPNVESWQAAAGPIAWTVSQPWTPPPTTDPGAATTSTTPSATTSATPTDLAALTRCGAPADDLAALANTQGAPYTASLSPHSTPYGYPNIPAEPTLTPVPGRSVFLATVEDPVVVAIQGGQVVARSVVSRLPNFPNAWTGGTTILYPDPPALTRCPGVPAPSDGGPGLQGSYGLQLVVELSVTGAEPGTWQIASAPIW
jgi:hypothetical protein